MHLRNLLVITFLFSVFFMSCGKDTKEAGTTTNNPSEVKTPDTHSSYEKFITAADIEKITGLGGVKSIQRDPSRGAGGDLNFVTREDKLIAMIQIVSIVNYEAYKQYYFKDTVNGLGDEAMKGATMKGIPENLLVFKKGDRCIALTSFMNMDDMSKNMLSIDQMTSLAKIMESRM